MLTRTLALALPGAFELLLLIGLAFAAFVLIRYYTRKGAQLPTLPSAFPVISMADGPGSYKVCGVDKVTRADKQLVLQADSRANAQVKAELDGIVVTSVEKIC